jgi:hypothetical protein
VSGRSPRARVAAFAAAGVASMSGIGVLLTAHPAAAAVPLGSYALTSAADAVATAGAVGLSGGLVTLDTGDGSVRGQLDSAPSSEVVAAPVRPGTFAETVAGQVNTTAGQSVLTLPEAHAQFPGTGTSTLRTVGPTTQGPLAATAGSADAVAGRLAASGQATGGSLAIAGGGAVAVVTSEAASAGTSLAAEPASGGLRVTARSTVSGLVVAGVLRLDDVSAAATIERSGSGRAVTSSLDVGAVTVAGHAVAITPAGVTVDGSALVPGETLRQTTEQVDTALSAAGVEVHLLAPTTTRTPDSAYVDTGGVAIDVVTPDAASGVPGNRVSIVVGEVTLTEQDAAPAPPVAPLPASAPPAAGIGATQAGPPGAALPAAGSTAALAPTVAAPALAPRAMVVLGRRLSTRTLLALFATWQFLSLTTPTLYALAARRRPGATGRRVEAS